MQKVWIRCSLNRWNIFAEQCRDWVEIRFCCDSSGKVFNGSSDLGQLRGLLARLLFQRTGYGIKTFFGFTLNWRPLQPSPLEIYFGGVSYAPGILVRAHPPPLCSLSFSTWY